MPFRFLRHKANRFAERESLSPNFGRGLRCMLSYVVPLGFALSGKMPVETAFAAITAQSIANVDVRGAYTLRFTLLIAMTSVLAGATALGAFMGTPLAAALLATLVVALGTGLWRHLSTDYGPSLAVSSSLLFFIALAQPGGAAAAGHHVVASLAGGLWGVFLQVAVWPLRPQHPLRAAVADAWVAASDFYTAMTPADRDAEQSERKSVAESEAALRTVQDKAYEVLASAAATRPSPLVSRLEQLNVVCARLAMRVAAFHSASEAMMPEPGFADFAPAFLPLTTVLSNLSRTVALCVVSRQPGHFAAYEVRAKRLTHMLRALRARLGAQTDGSPAWAQLGEILRHIEEQLPAVSSALRATIERADERAAFSLELFDLQTVTLRPLAAALHFSWKVDPALIRYTLRIAVLTLIGVAIFKTHHLPHGYWLPFTMVVVLQPDYGSTRQKAAQRLVGTLIGSILASFMLWLRLPLAGEVAAIVVTAFCFGYTLRRNYGLAVIFITLFVVLVTETSGPTSIAFTEERLGSTVAGGLFALIAALVFWPIWERDRYRPFVARALRSTEDYLKLMITRLTEGGASDPVLTKAKRKAESANTNVFSSLQRMMADPKNRREGVQQVAAIANGNQRLIRALNLLSLHLTEGAPLRQWGLQDFSQRAAAALEALALSIENPSQNSGTREAGAQLDSLRLPSPKEAASDGTGPKHAHWVLTQLARATTELSAMLLAADSAQRGGHQGHGESDEDNAQGPVDPMAVG